MSLFIRCSSVIPVLFFLLLSTSVQASCGDDGERACCAFETGYLCKPGMDYVEKPNSGLCGGSNILRIQANGFCRKPHLKVNVPTSNNQHMQCSNFNIKQGYTPVSRYQCGISVPVGNAWVLGAIGDVNGDGTDDIIWQYKDILSNKNGQVHYWLMRDGKRISGHDISTPVHADWILAGAGDVDGDRTDDIIWRHNVSGMVHYWKMKNGTRVSGQDIQVVSKPPKLVTVADLNGDGTDDIVWRVDRLRTGWNSRWTVHYWKMQNGRRVASIDLYDEDFETFIGAGDLDKNGTDDIVTYRPDPVGKYLHGYYMYALLSPGMEKGSFKPGHVLISDPMDRSLIFAGFGDMNGDGFDDVVFMKGRQVIFWQTVLGELTYYPYPVPEKKSDCEKACEQNSVARGIENCALGDNCPAAIVTIGCVLACRASNAN